MMPKLIKYKNTLPHAVSFSVGTVPGGPTVDYDLDGGEEFDGPAAYRNFFARHHCEPVDGGSLPKPAAVPVKMAPPRDGPAKAVSQESSKEPEPEPEPEPVAEDAPVVKAPAKKKKDG